MRTPSDKPSEVLEALWVMLCDGFETELERQETVLSLCIAQGQAARAHDLEYLEAKTAALSRLTIENAQAEPARQDLVRQLAEHYEFDAPNPPLSALIAVAPGSSAVRLRELQGRMQAVTSETRRTITENNRVIRRALRVVQVALSVITRCQDAPSGHYGCAGQEQHTPVPEAALLDRKG